MGLQNPVRIFWPSRVHKEGLTESCGDLSTKQSLALERMLPFVSGMPRLVSKHLNPSVSPLRFRCKSIIVSLPRLQTGKCLKESDPETGHAKVITSMAKSADGSHFITGSHDKTSKLWDIRTLTVLKTYTTERPVNAAAISPLLDHVCFDS